MKYQEFCFYLGHLKASENIGIIVITAYENPKDFPDKYVARVSHTNKDGINTP